MEASAPRRQQEGLPGETTGAYAKEVDAIVVCGRRYPIDAPVVLWTEPPFYDGYRAAARFAEEGPIGLRYQSGRNPRSGELEESVEKEGWTLENLRRQVDLFVLHYDVAGTSRSCFEILHDKRELSVHFLLDVDGTLYQTLDLKEQAWHAKEANARSVGIEIANIGAYELDAPSPLDDWYAEDEKGAWLQLPKLLGDGGVRTEGYFEGKPRPARPKRIRGEVHGVSYEQYDFTEAQYQTLIALSATLNEVLPGIELKLPRDGSGEVRNDAFSPLEFEEYRGILGHQHLSVQKRDPGPAFDWERFLFEVRRERAGP